MRCGFYEKEITPPIGSELPGQYALRVSTGVLDRLYAKAAVFDDGTRLAALLALDAVELPDGFCREICRRVEELTGIREENLAVCATHTHQGIPTGEPIGSREDKGFLHELGRLAADCVALAAKALEPCSLYFANGRVDGISFVRDYVMEDGEVRTNPGKAYGKLIRPYSENDPDLPALFARDKNGGMLGMIYGFACHQDCVGGSEFTGDYSSEVARKIYIYKAVSGKDISYFIMLPHAEFIAEPAAAPESFFPQRS